MLERLGKAKAYLGKRMLEKSTWGGVVAAVTTASAVGMPWAGAALAAGVIAILVPTSGGDNEPLA